MVPLVPVAGEGELLGLLLELLPPMPVPDELPPMPPIPPELEGLEGLEGLMLEPLPMELLEPLPIELLPALLPGGQLADPLAPVGGQSAALPPELVLPAVPDAPELPLSPVPPDEDGMLEEGEDGLVAEGLLVDGLVSEGIALELPEPMLEPLLLPELEP